MRSNRKMSGYRATVAMAPTKIWTTFIQTMEAMPASMSRKPRNTASSTPKMMEAFRNCFQPLLMEPKVSRVTAPAARNITKSSIPPPQKISRGSSETTYTGRMSRLRKNASRYSANTGNGTM